MRVPREGRSYKQEAGSFVLNDLSQTEQGFGLDEVVLSQMYPVTFLSSKQKHIHHLKEITT